jgi:DNA-binding NarL/FixJ family response regulator
LGGKGTPVTMEGWDMKKFALFLISVTLFLGMIKLLQKTKENLQLFTQREQEILNDIAIGYSENEISELLHASERSIQLCKSNILRKTNLPDISSAIQYALEKGLVGITYA